MVQCLARYRMGRHTLAIQTGRYNKTARHKRVCKICDALGYQNEEGEIPLEDLMHFLLECRGLTPVRAEFPALFQPAVLSSEDGNLKDAHMRFILNHTDHAQVVRCLLSLEKHQTECLALIAQGRMEEVVPIEHEVPLDYNLARLIAYLADSDDSDFD
jgi:hypothetical protein